MSRRPTIAVDLDGTILEYDGWNGEKSFGKAREGAAEALKAWKADGFRVVIWTRRGDAKAVARHLRKIGIPFDHVNEVPGDDSESPKIPFDLTVDDKAVSALQPWPVIDRKVRKLLGRTASAIRVSAEVVGMRSFRIARIAASVPGLAPVRTMVIAGWRIVNDNGVATLTDMRTGLQARVDFSDPLDDLDLARFHCEFPGPREVAMAIEMMASQRRRLLSADSAWTGGRSPTPTSR
jgi:hypothetical protein